MQGSEEFFGPVEHTLVNFGAGSCSNHFLVPHVDYDEDIFDTHLLQLSQKFLSAPFLCSIFVTLFNELVLIVNLNLEVGLGHAVCKNLCFCL